MNIHFRNPSGELSQKLIDRVEKKLTKLQKFVIERNYEAQLFVDINKESGSNTSDNMWRASLNLDLAGDRYNASELANTPETAGDRAIRELMAELRTAHGKQRAEYKRGGSVLKRLVRGFA